MTLYNKFKTYSLDPNKISVVKGRLHPNRWYVVVRKGGIEYVGGRRKRNKQMGCVDMRKLFFRAMGGYLEPNRYAIVRSSTEQWWYVFRGANVAYTCTKFEDALNYLTGKVK